MIAFILQLLLFRWLIKWGLKLAGWTFALVVMVAAAPVTTVALAGYVTAWLRG